MTTIRSLHKREPFRRLPTFNYRKGTKNRPAALACTSSPQERVQQNTPVLKRLYQFLAKPLP